MEVPTDCSEHQGLALLNAAEKLANPAQSLLCLNADQWALWGRKVLSKEKTPQQSSNTNLVSMAFLETWAFSFFFPFLLILKMFWIVDFPGESKWQSRKKFEGAEGRRRKCQTKASWNEKGETPWSQSRAEQLAAVSLACVTRSGWCNPSQHRVQNWMIFKVSSQPSHSVILNTGGKLCLYSWLL